MCEYSLIAVTSRRAEVGDRLVTMRFPHALTRGFFAVAEPGVAVCLLPGTELAFDQDVECDHPLAWLPNTRFGKLAEKLAQFRHVNMASPYAHHDALEFANGKTVLLTRLRLDQGATVLQLPVQPEIAQHSTVWEHIAPVT
jgi:hypothetical protein